MSSERIGKQVVGLIIVTGTTAVVFLLFLLGNTALTSHASSGGRHNYSGNPATLGGASCSSCHNSVEHQAPEVWIDGPTAVLPGELVTYTLTIQGGPAVIGGFNVSATDGRLQAIPGLTTTQTLTNFLGQAEVTHTSPPAAFNDDHTLTFPFLWQVPTDKSVYLFYGAGLSANASSDPAGDVANKTTFLITVGLNQQSFLPLTTTP